MSEIQQALQDASRALERATTAFRSASVGHFRRTEIRPEPKQLLAAAAEIVCAQGLIALAMRRRDGGGWAMTGVKRRITAGQRIALMTAEQRAAYYPGPEGASTARSLVKRGLMSRPRDPGGPYRITDAGRAALHERLKGDGA